MTVFDQIGTKLTFKEIPKRIVCLVPSLSELIVDLGLEEFLVGVTKFCVHPINLKQNKVIIGGTKNISEPKIKQLQPDLIFANKEENVASQVIALNSFCQVYTSDIKDIDDLISFILQLGIIFNIKPVSDKLISNLESLVSTLSLNQPVSNENSSNKKKSKENKSKESKSIENKSIEGKLNQRERKPTFVYLIWKNPYMAAGSDTYISYFLELMGLKNKIIQQRYPEIDLEICENADFVFLSSEPFPFKNSDAEDIKNLMSKKTEVMCVDGEAFSWYGSRSIHLKAYYTDFKSLISHSL